ncbi:hypothetical protein [Nostoc sp.]|uniref:hypothetical protein n=1 Tax=Nostoc sp. TaxID=1180 RepID=UPI002FFA11AD
MPNAQCPMPNAQCPIPNSPCPMPHAQSPIPNTLPLKTANTTLMLRFTLITESTNSHTLDRVKANQSMNQLKKLFS